MNEIVIYQAEDGQARLQVHLERETVWLSLAQMVELFGRDKSVISRHLRNVFSEGELRRESVVAKFATTAADGKTYQVDYYNLDVIISVGYRVKSQQGTRFRQWATRVLRSHIVEGYTLNEQRLREASVGCDDDRNRIVRGIWRQIHCYSPDSSGNKLDRNWYGVAITSSQVAYASDAVRGLTASYSVTLLIAESRPEEKDILVKVIVNLINRSND